jgi:hypothetical protein
MADPKNPHDHTPEEEHEIRESALDETIEDSFPASDPPSTLPNPDQHDTDWSPQGDSGPGAPSPKHRAPST